MVLDTNITQSLKNEGLSRDIIRNIQQARKDSGLEVENYIKLSLKSESTIVNDAIEQCEKLIQNEVLATTLITSGDNYEYIKEVKIEGEDLSISLEKDVLSK